jgi:hypothetical protein
MDAVLFELQIQICVGKATGTPSSASGTFT